MAKVTRIRPPMGPRMSAPSASIPSLSAPSTSPAPVVLDCTLRDGGYHNDWAFAPSIVRALVGALERSGVDLVEMGYKSPPDGGVHGSYRYCRDEQLAFLREYRHLKFCFMLDAKAFIDDSRAVHRAALEACVLPAADSVFSWCRVAAHYADLAPAIELARVLSEELGYRVCLNLMGISLLSESQLEHALGQLQRSAIEVLYFADSFGSLTPARTRAIVATIRARLPQQIGFHAHDNQGLAFANSLAAIEAGAGFVDATIAGMGRGAGNLRTEQLLLAIGERGGRPAPDASELLELIESYFAPMQQVYRWGFSYTYMLSGLLEIHPSYGQQLGSGKGYTQRQIAEILSALEPGQRATFDGTALEAATQRVLRQQRTRFELPSRYGASGPLAESPASQVQAL